MLKIVLTAFVVLTLVACNRFGGKTEKTTQPPHKTQRMTGAYGQQQTPTEEELALFRSVTTELDGVSYTPQSVARQVVAGTNYRFICTAVIAAREPENYQAEVVVYKPLPGHGEARITKITRL